MTGHEGDGTAVAWRGILLAAFLALLSVVTITSARAAVTIPSETFNDENNSITYVAPGDTLVLPFYILNTDTDDTAVLTQISFYYTSSDMSAGDFTDFTIHDASGGLLAQTAAVNSGAAIILAVPAGSDLDTAIYPGSRTTFYFCMPTLSGSAGGSLKLSVNNGIITAPVAPDTHNITSGTLSVMNVTAATDTARGDLIVGANSQNDLQMYYFNLLNNTGRDLTINKVQLTFSNVRGFVPGGPSPDDAPPTGDLSLLKFTRVTAGDVTLSRTSAKMDVSESTHYVIDFEPSSPKWNDDPAQSPYLLPTNSSPSYFYLHFRMHDYISDFPSPGGLVPGDAFKVTMDSIEIANPVSTPGWAGWVGNTNPSIVLNIGSATGIIYELLGEIEHRQRIVHPHLDATGSTYDDQKELDFIPYRPLMALYLTGGPGNQQGIHKIRLVATHAPGTVINGGQSPLRRIDQTDWSGLQIRGTTDGFYSSSDTLYPLYVSDPFITVGTDNTTIDLVVNGYAPLPLDETLAPGGENDPRFWIGIESSEYAQYADSITFCIPPGGIEFMSGLVMYETRALSLIDADSDAVEGSGVYPLTDTSYVLYGTPVIWQNLVASGQTIIPRSQPTAVVGINAWNDGKGDTLGRLIFNVMDAALAGGEKINQTDFNALADTTTSGWSVYRDNIWDSRNQQGVFDAGIDIRLPLVFNPGADMTTRYVPYGTNYSASALSRYSALYQPQIVQLVVSDTITAEVPATDADSFAGNDFFLVCRTSPNITPNNKFSVVVGNLDPNILNGVEGGVEFESITLGPPLFYTRDNVFSRGIGSANIVIPTDVVVASAPSGDACRSNIVSVVGGIAINPVNLIPSQKYVYRNNVVALFGLNAQDSGGGISISSILVEVVDTGEMGDFCVDTGDLAPVVGENKAGNGLVLYYDIGDTDGEVDANDTPVTGSWTLDSVYAGGHTMRYKFTFFSPYDFPDSNEAAAAGYDLLIAATMGDSLVFMDKGAFSLSDTAFSLIPEDIISQPPPIYTAPVVGGLPTKLNPYPDTAGSLPITGDPVAAIGILAQDRTETASGDVRMDKVKVWLDELTSGGNFPTAILASITTGSSSESSGVSVWRDVDTNGIFNREIDTVIPILSRTWLNGNTLELDLDNDYGDVPPTDSYMLSDTAGHYFVVLRAASDSRWYNRRVQVKVLATMEPSAPWVKFTSPSDPTQSVTSGVFTISPPNVTGSFTPHVFSPNGDAVMDTVSVTLTLSSTITDSLWYMYVRKKSSGVSELINSASCTTATFSLGRIAPAVTDTPRVDWPSTFNGGGAFEVYFNYDRGDTRTDYTMGETLYADLKCTSPTLTSGELASVTTETYVTISLAADNDRSTPDKYALTIGESAAVYYIFYQGQSEVVLTGSMVDYAASNLAVPLLPGANTLLAVLRDTAGNWSDTLTIGTISRSVGGDQTIIDTSSINSVTRQWLGWQDTIPVFGINLTQSVANEFVTAVTLQIFDSGPNPPQLFGFGKNIDNVPWSGTYPDSAGIVWYKDNRTAGTSGIWDPLDEHIGINVAQRKTTYTSGDTIRFVFQSPLPVYANDTDPLYNGNDYFVVLQGGAGWLRSVDGAMYRDSFVIAIPTRGIEFATSNPGRSQAVATYSPPIITRPPREFVDRSAAHETIAVGADWTEIIGLSMTDSTRQQGGGDVRLSKITLYFDIAAGDTFNPTILDYALYQDTGTADTGVFSPVTDSRITATATLISNNQIVFTIASGDTHSDIPDKDNNCESGADFWIVVRPNVTGLSVTNKFKPYILAGGVETTGDSLGSYNAGAGVICGTRIQVPSGGTTTSIAPNPFRPTADSRPYGYYDTAGYTIALSDTTPFSVYLVRVNGNLYNETYFFRSANLKDTVMVFSAADTTGWKTDEYLIRLGVWNGTDTSWTTEATKLYADMSALTPGWKTTPATTVSDTSISVTTSVSAVSDTSGARARSRAEQDSFVLLFQIQGAAAADTREYRAYRTLSGKTTDEYTITLQLFQGLNSIRVSLTDKVGNTDSSLIATVNAGTAVTGDITYVDGTPMFRYTTNHQEFLINFPEPVQAGSCIELYGASGSRLRMINITPGAMQTGWNARNDDGELMRNGIYLLKFKVTLQSGKAINETRTIFLLK